MNDKELYLLVESGPILEACAAWRERYIAAQHAAFEFAKSFGANIYFPGFDNEFLALPVLNPVPKGWKVTKPGRHAPRMVPVKGKEGDEARAAIAALAPFPKHQEIADLIGCTCTIHYTRSGADGYSGSNYVGRFMNPVQLFWPAGDGPMLIMAPNMEAAINQAMIDYPKAIITHGHWTIPEGLRVVSEARKDLIIAQAKVAAEEARG